eukprot:CAMPEP_0180620808 /NCGR_PEP_ID=MMETSP1037_2-20121125/34801_1 /TAXON_ID=632150 /ORGANISM="Azadinium spinosum, Strain 3D9" /LENGTH=129 /DNA_ID=CAMNT_0022640919 /DNA_START=326 /DNA_END=712 /DNA_ORIENTATION=-
MPFVLAASTILSPSSSATSVLVREGPRMLMKVSFMSWKRPVAGRGMLISARQVVPPSLGTPSTISQVALTDSVSGGFGFRTGLLPRERDRDGTRCRLDRGGELDGEARWPSRGIFKQVQMVSDLRTKLE